jgi:hypothetical protein
MEIGMKMTAFSDFYQVLSQKLTNASEVLTPSIISRVSDIAYSLPS